jgi:hypothetical protein
MRDSILIAAGLLIASTAAALTILRGHRA